MPYAKNHIRVKVPHRSGFDKSHRNSGTAKCGTLVPILCDEVIPNSRVSLRIPINAQMPPLASNTYMNVKLKIEAFFVPMRILCGSFESWFTDFPKRTLSGGSSTAPYGLFTDVKGSLPIAVLQHGESSFPYSYFGKGSLSDYLGCKFDSIEDDLSGAGFELSLMPYLAYHKVWEDFYRNPRVQNPAFAPVTANTADNGSYMRVASIPYDFLHESYVDAYSNTVRANNSLGIDVAADISTNFKLADGATLFDLRQRNFGLDYFTGARVSPQQGDASSVSFSISGEADESGDVTGSGAITIAAIRAANSLQQFRERNNLPSPRMQDQVSARYGANLSDGVAQRPICIGTATYDMQSSGVNQTAGGSGASGSNPFSSVAAQYGRASVSGNDFIINDFLANEPGYIMVLMSQVPEVSYSYGVDKIFTRYSSPSTLVNMANPLLQNVGDEPIYISEVCNAIFENSQDNRIFGYTDRYAGFMFKPNQIHGEFLQATAGSSLAGTLPSFVLQRALRGTSHELSSSFLQIPTNYMDNILAVSADTANCTYWYDCILDYKVSMPLAEYSIPSLQDPAYEHGETVNLRRNGQIF